MHFQPDRPSKPVAVCSSHTRRTQEPSAQLLSRLRARREGLALLVASTERQLAAIDKQIERHEATRRAVAR